MTRRTGLIGLAGAFLAACTPARFLDSVFPDDGATTLIKDVSFGDNPRQKLDVYGPPDGRPGAPVAMFVYGGGWSSGSRREYQWAGKMLAAQGFVTIVADYRLTPEVSFPGFVEDVAAAVRWAVDHTPEHGGDPSRIVMVGHSAGAYNAAMVALDPRYLKAVGVDRSRIKAFAGLAGPYYFPNLDGPILSRTFAGASDDKIYQTLDYAGPGSPAAFLVAGDADKTVRPRNTERLAEALRKEGVEVESHIYPGQSHADVLLNLSRTFRGRSPQYGQLTSFLRKQAGLA
ncbi:alpha/beta hydrolase [Caulobacter sp. NIBR1757]|uniref:alpha/beta hydrolase n=1 Tax=Caulobacter sp. NIBR1757 TaxID=3016000 RepID=UPI0022F11811|nr:alpha/beta hydrolase [Caulobacter sp. NIBR1757]